MRRGEAESTAPEYWREYAEKTFLRKIRGDMDRNDVVTLVGMGCLAGGLWMIYPPAALIAVGLVLIVVGVLGAWRKATPPWPSPSTMEREKRGR